MSTPEIKLKELKLKKLELLAQKKRYEDTHQLEFFEPQEQQQTFFDALQDTQLSTYLILGGNRSGKSAALAASVCSFVQGRFPWIKPPVQQQAKSVSINADGSITVDGQTFADDKAWKEHKQASLVDRGLLRFKLPIKVRVLGEDFEKAIGQVLLPYFFKFIPPELIVGKRKGQTGVYNQILVQSPYNPNHVSVIDFLTYAQGAEVMEGWDGHLTAYDEPPPRAVYIANQRGLVDHRGISIFALTPLKEPWIADEIANSTEPSIRTFVFKSHDNKHINQEALSEFEKKLNPDERETRIEGKFLHLQGLVFKEFKKEVHVVEPFEVTKQYTVYAAIDSHPRTQQAVMFMAVDQKSRKWVIHEIFQHGTPDEIADWIINFHDDVHKIQKVLIEPASQGDTNRGDSTFQIIERRLAEQQIPLEFGSKDLAGGILQVREHLKSANQQASLWIFNTCVVTIKEMMNYIWADWSKSSDKGEKQKPRDANDHMVENMRRLIQHPIEFVGSGFYTSLLEQANAPYKPVDPISGY